jgi:hypothetical protein
MTIIDLILFRLAVLFGRIIAKCDTKPFFEFDGKTRRYFIHPHNNTWMNERMVEIPIVSDLVKQNAGKNILEIGNVIKHYMPDATHTVVDKYEKSDGVLNCDIIDYQPPAENGADAAFHGYDLIISISTFEHIGFDESKYGNNNAISGKNQNLARAIEK